MDNCWCGFMMAGFASDNLKIVFYKQGNIKSYHHVARNDYQNQSISSP